MDINDKMIVVIQLLSNVTKSFHTCIDVSDLKIITIVKMYP